MKTLPFRMALTLLISILVSACGGGGSSDSGILINGTLTQGGDEDHSLAFFVKHSAGEKIEEVKICALGECSTTDTLGQWGLVAPDGFSGGEVEFVVQGHGIDTSTIIDIPQANEQVFIELEHHDGNVEAHHIEVDGREVE